MKTIRSAKLRELASYLLSCSDPLDLPQASFGPSGPKVKKSEVSPRVPLGPGGVQEVQNRVKNEVKSTTFNYFQLIFDPVSDFWGVPKSAGPWDSLSDFFSTLGPGGPNDPCSRSKGSKLS